MIKTAPGPQIQPLDGEQLLRPEAREQVLAQLRAVRDGYLEALPVAGAVFGYADGRAALESANAAFALVDCSSDGARFAAEVDAFMAGEETVRELDWSDGCLVEGRHYVMRLARVASFVSPNPHCLLTLIDRTAERQTEKALRMEMLGDALTGLPNRAGFIEHLETVLGEAAEDRHFAVLIVDLARFSRINESIGSLSGDELLITVARRLMSALRAGDVIGRIGSDEFAILMRLVDGPGDALHVAQRIEAVLEPPCRLSDLEISVDCAIGCALFEGDQEPEELVRHAQFAVKRAKASGKVEVYQPTAFNQARRRFSLETELRRAIEGERLRLAYQPLIDLGSNSLIGFEALARWTDGERGEIEPQEFIPVAEESGLIVPLGRWALDAATRTLAGWDAAAGRPLPLYMSVNVSAIQLARDDVAGAARAALDATDLQGCRLTLELTESAIIADPDRATRVTRALKEFGAMLAMDDFGTGYSNLAYLQRLPIDILKIDRSFITGMLSDRDKVAIVRAILSLAHALGMKTVAEGIETLELSQTLGALGCAIGQGFYYARPLDESEALDFLRANMPAATC